MTYLYRALYNEKIENFIECITMINQVLCLRCLAKYLKIYLKQVYTAYDPVH